MEAAEVRRIRIDTANRERKKKEIEILEKKEEEQRRTEELEKKVCILFLFRLIALPQECLPIF